MRVVVRPSDLGPCGSYRLMWPGRAVKREFDVTIVDRRHVGDVLDYEADVVVLQRPVDHRLARAIPELRKRGTAVVVDMDDDLSCVHPENPAWHRAMEARDTVAQACKDATLVTVTTPALAKRYGSHGRVSVLPNCVPQSYLNLPHKDSSVVGWGGNLQTHPDDLQVMGDAVVKHVSRGGKFNVVGPSLGIGRTLGLKDPLIATGEVSLTSYPLAVSRLGIGLAPLADTLFNAAKSRLRPLQYAALGVPWIGSPRADYLAFHELGTGAMAETPDEWFRLIKRLVNNPARRLEQIEAGRTVARDHTIEGNAWRWAEAWAAAVEMQRSNPRDRTYERPRV